MIIIIKWLQMVTNGYKWLPVAASILALINSEHEHPVFELPLDLIARFPLLLQINVPNIPFLLH